MQASLAKVYAELYHIHMEDYILYPADDCSKLKIQCPRKSDTFEFLFRIKSPWTAHE